MKPQISTDNSPSLDDMPSVIIDTVFRMANSEEEQDSLSRVSLTDEKGEVLPKGIWDPASSLFGGSVKQRAERLKKALGHELITGNIPRAERLLEQNPWLFNEEVEGTDHCGRTLKEKPIPFVARLNDFNPRSPKEKEEPFGAVERLSKIAIESGRLTHDEIGRQINEVLPCHWDEMTDERMQHYGLDPDKRDLLHSQHTFPWQAITAKHMQKYRDACEALVKDLARIRIPQDITLEEALVLPEVRAAADTFQNAIQNKGNQPTAGLVFDPTIFLWFIDRFWGKDGDPGWKKMLYSQWTLQSDLLFVLGYGGLQFHDTACGLQAYKKGILSVISRINWQLPDRLMNFSEGVPDDLSGLGRSDCLTVSGVYRPGPDRGLHGLCFLIGGGGEVRPPLQILCLKKTAGLLHCVRQNFVQSVLCL